MQPAGRAHVLDDLRERILRIERPPDRAEITGLSTGLPALDGLLAHRGLKPGSLIEWLGDGEGSGAAELALTVAAHLLKREGALVVIDGAGEFYPPAAVEKGVPLPRMAVVRPPTRMTGLWAWEQALRCPAVAVTFGSIDAINDRLFRRLQLAVETGGGVGFLLRPPADQAAPSWASTRIMVRAGQIGPPCMGAALERIGNAGPIANPRCRDRTGIAL